MSRREFRFSEGTSNKFWAITLKGSSFVVHFGKVGTAGQCQEKQFASEAMAQKEHDKLVAEKVKKGYVEGQGVSAATGEPNVTVKSVSKTEPKAKNGTSATSRIETSEAADATLEVALAKSVTAVSGLDSNVNAEATETSMPILIGDSLIREMRLEPEDWFVVPWKDHEPLPRPESPAFDRELAMTKLNEVAKQNPWERDWRKAKIPAFPTIQEARFWLHAASLLKTKSDWSVAITRLDLDVDLPVKVLDEALCSLGNIKALDSCVARCLAIDWNLDDLERCSEIYEQALRYVVPYLSREERKEWCQKLDQRLRLTAPSSYYESWTADHYLAAALGGSAKVVQSLAQLPDKHYPINGGWSTNSYHQTQWLVFGLSSSEAVESEFQRLGLTLRGEASVRYWLALTEYRRLDVIAASVRAHSNKDDAAQVAKGLLRVIAPEAAVPALEIRINSKAPQIGQQWLVTNPLQAAVGLAPVAMGTGKLAEAAREHLMTLRRNGMENVLRAALTYLDTKVQRWLAQEIIDSDEAKAEAIPFTELPNDLQAHFSTVNSGTNVKNRLGIVAGMLPLIMLDGKCLGKSEVEKVLFLVITTSLERSHPLFKALKTYATAQSLDAVALKIFDTWLSLGADSKEKWAMGALGHMGSDRSVFKLTPLIREWPGESQHKRAVFGLEILRAIGTDTALMALNGIALKLKFAALKEKAKEMMESIAKDRGLTREQLADRIVPDCGLNAQGTRIFDFGPRQFKFVMGPEGKPMIRDSAGRIKPDLPNLNQSDNKVQGEAEVSEWKLLKKMLKETFKIQAERLEQAMITGRRWTHEEFDTLLVRHPLMVNLVRQLIWAAYDAKGQIIQTFRVTEDQAFGNASDDVFTLPSEASVGIVHRAHLEDSIINAWGELLSDYEIIPPFQQLNRSVYRPDPDDLSAVEITRFKGPKIPGITLYGILERTHWVKDTPADAGGFMQHSKYFPAADLTAFIQYTGMSIGYYDEQQEIESIYFVPGHAKPDWWGKHDNKLPIRNVDSVVISEVLRLVHAILAKAA